MIDNLEIANCDDIITAMSNGEYILLNAEFKLALNAYLKRLVSSPVRPLADVIAFNKKNSDLVSNENVFLIITYNQKLRRPFENYAQFMTGCINSLERLPCSECEDCSNPLYLYITRKFFEAAYETTCCSGNMMLFI